MRDLGEQEGLRPGRGVTTALVMFLLSLLASAPLTHTSAAVRSAETVEAVGVQAAMAISRSDERLSDSACEHDPWTGAPELSQTLRLAIWPSAPQDHCTSVGASVGAALNYEARAPPLR